eukprot:gene13194-17796_t
MRSTVERLCCRPVVLVGGFRQVTTKLAETLRDLGLWQAIAVSDDAIELTLKANRPPAIILVEPSREAAERARDRIMRCLGDPAPPIIW